MALGKPGRTDGKSYSLKLKLKEGDRFLDCAQFEVQEKQGDKYVVIDKVTDVGGDLFSVTTREGEFEGNAIRSFKLGLRDPEKNEAYFVDASLGSSVGRNLANSILNLSSLENVDIGLYGQKSKTNGKTYPAVAIRQGGLDETVKWKYDPKDGVIPPVREFQGKGGRTEKDYTEQELFLFQKLAEFGETLKSRSPKPATAPTAQTAPAGEPAKTEAPKRARTTKAAAPVAATTVPAKAGDDGIPF